MKKSVAKSKSKTRNSKKTSYLSSFIDYQDKMYLPGSFLGGEIHPALRAQSRVGGYLMIITGIFLLIFYVSPLIGNISIEEDNDTLAFALFPLLFSILLIFVGQRFTKK